MNQEILANILDKWAKYPVRLNIVEINDRSELPPWQKCKKNELWIGIEKGKKSDTVYVIRHRLETVFKLAGRFDNVRNYDLYIMGIYPQYRHYCKECGEFSTRINKDGRCCDCLDDKEQGGIEDENKKGFCY